MTSSTASFDEIRILAAGLPQLHLRIWEDTNVASTTTAIPSIANTAWVASVQRRASPSLDHLRVALFAASHGIAADLADGAPQFISEQVRHLISGSNEVAHLAEAADCELKLHELALDRPTRDSRLGPAMEESEAATAAAYGMMAVDPGVDAVALADLGSTSGFAAVSLGLALVPDSRTPDARTAAALARHRDVSDPLQLLAALGGPDIAAMLGAILASRLAGIPVLLDGPAAQAAAAVAWRLRPDAIDHCRIAAPGPALPLGLPIASQLSHSMAPPKAGIAALAALRQACTPGAASFPEL